MTQSMLALKELSPLERGRLAEHEATIERGLQTFVEVGAALLAIRDARLYRDEYGTFEDYCGERWGMSKPYATQLIQAAGVVRNLVAIATVLPANEAQARPLAALRDDPEQQRAVWQAAVETAPRSELGAPIITAAHVQRTVDQMAAPLANGAPVPAPLPHVAQNTGNNEWYTPPEYISAAQRVLGIIDLDPASTAEANRTVGAERFYSASDDGLAQPWAGRVWMNPPYAGDLIGAFCARLVEGVEAGTVLEAIVLVNNATETAWFAALVGIASAVVFPRGRVRFLDPYGNPGAPLQGQAVLYVGDDVGTFLYEFAAFGWGCKL